MRAPAILAKNLGKRYSISVKGEENRESGEGLERLCRSLTSWACDPMLRAKQREDIWPLRDVSFEIGQGEVVGVIGRNGAGKSTLLKILSRITEPTTGRVEVFGRVGTLLEVGTGFHPELTGRDNIYLSGIILGMKRGEVAKKFDEIVEFAGIGKFVDTPVKRYSSGMYVRLAFAVGAHLEPEVLIVDEVLAVGDMQFQAKCLDKMQQIGAEGRTVLFVSHNMQAITRLCQRALLLDKGSLVADGPPAKIVGQYLHAGGHASTSVQWSDPTTAPGDATARLRALRIVGPDGRPCEAIDVRHEFNVEMEFDVSQPGRVLVPNIVLTNDSAVDLFETFDLDPAWRGRPRPSGRYRARVTIPGNLLAEGTYFVSPSCFSVVPHEIQFYEREVVAFQVVDSVQGDSARGDYSGEMLGLIRPKLIWNTQYSLELVESWRPNRAA